MSAWKEVRLDDLVVFRNGKSTKGIDDGDFPIFGSNGIIGASAKAMYENAIILGRVGAYCGSVAYCTGKFWATDNTIVVEPKAGIFDVRFAQYVLQHADLNRQATGSAQPLLTQTNLRGLLFNVPPLAEQCHIASILGAYDDLIEVNRRRVSVLEETARGLFEEWFVRFRFPGHEKHKIKDTPDGPLPEGWKLSSLGQLADIQWGDTSTTKSSYTPDGYLAFSASGPDGFMDHYDFDRIGVVLSAIGANCGRTWLTRGQWSCIKNTMRFWSKENTISTEYLYLATLGSENWPKRGAAQLFVSLGDARKIAIIHPAGSISTSFEKIVSAQLQFSANLSRQMIALAAARDLLLPRLISGELSVAAAERELEAAA